MHPGPSLNPTVIPKTSSVLELPNLLENVSLGEESGKISKDDMAIVSHKNLNFFSSLRVRKTDRVTKKVTEGQENDIWSMVSNLRQKGTGTDISDDRMLHVSLNKHLSDRSM